MEICINGEAQGDNVKDLEWTSLCSGLYGGLCFFQLRTQHMVEKDINSLTSWFSAAPFTRKKEKILIQMTFHSPNLNMKYFWEVWYWTYVPNITPSILSSFFLKWSKNGRLSGDYWTILYTSIVKYWFIKCTRSEINEENLKSFDGGIFTNTIKHLCVNT